MEPPLVRPAAVADAEAITHLMRTGMSARVQRFTILGSPLLQHWVTAQLESATGDTFLIATLAGRVAGMASSRQIGPMRVLNHLYIDAAARQRGVARALLARTLEGEAETVAVDVFPESRVARKWYASLGFTVEYRRLWLESTLPRPDAGLAASCIFTGLDDADLAQARQGFSTFILTSPRSTYTIGRLANGVFRAIGCSLLADAPALAALAILDPGRTLLTIAPPEDATPSARIVEESERLTALRTTVTAQLSRPTA